MRDRFLYCVGVMPVDIWLKLYMEYTEKEIILACSIPSSVPIYGKYNTATEDRLMRERNSPYLR